VNLNEKERTMSWLNDEIEEIRRQQQLKQQQEEAQRAREMQAYDAKRAAEDQQTQKLKRQAVQLLELLVQALQLRKLMRDTNQAWGRQEIKEGLNVIDEEGNVSNPASLAIAAFGITISYHHPRVSDPWRRGTGHPAYDTTISVGLMYEAKASPGQQYSISFSGPGDQWEGVITQYNHSQIIARLKQSLAQAIFGDLRK